MGFLNICTRYNSLGQPTAGNIFQPLHRHSGGVRFIFALVFFFSIVTLSGRNRGVYLIFTTSLGHYKTLEPASSTMFVATSTSLFTSGSIQQCNLKPSSRLRTQRRSATVAFISQNQSNTSHTSDTTNLRRGGDSSRTTAEEKRQQHSTGQKKSSEKSRVTAKAVEGTNLFSMDDDYSFITVEDLLTA